jgi:hypothetical protein
MAKKQKRQTKKERRDSKYRTFAASWTAFEEHAIPPETQAEKLFVNSRYHVFLRRIPHPGLEPGEFMVHLSIKRNDREPLHDWRDLQRIKNELCDPECEAVEVYPAESRVVDTSNQYHLWVLPKGKLVPFGFFEGRLVADADLGNAKQRKFEVRPKDLTSPEELAEKVAEQIR